MAELTWADVDAAAKSAFAVYREPAELRWAKHAWAHVSAAGLTSFGTELERCRVCVRFLSLCGLYHDWWRVARAEGPWTDYKEWADLLDMDAFRIAQLAGRDLADDLDGIDWRSADADLREALERLSNEARSAVARAIKKGFGGDSMLFLSLSRSNEPTPEAAPGTDQLALALDGGHAAPATPNADDDADEEDGDGPQDDWDVLNNVTDEKMIAFEWITNDCPPCNE